MFGIDEQISNVNKHSIIVIKHQIHHFCSNTNDIHNKVFSIKIVNFIKFYKNYWAYLFCLCLSFFDILSSSFRFKFKLLGSHFNFQHSIHWVHWRRCGYDRFTSVTSHFCWFRKFFIEEIYVIFNNLSKILIFIIKCLFCN